MKNAMREREAGKFRLSVIRMVRSSIKNAEINDRCELDDEQVLAILVKELKMRRDSLEEFTKAGRSDLAEPTQREIEILLGYLPEQIEPAQIHALVEQAVVETGATGPKDMGKVMSIISPKVKGKADGKLVSSIVKEVLSINR